MKEASQRFQAAIIQNNFFKFRNVQEILYDSDERENVRQTVERLQRFEYNPNTHKQLSSHGPGVNFRVGPNFTWIHLPASNDAVKKILKKKDCKDETEKMPYLYFSTYHKGESDRDSGPKIGTKSPEERLVLDEIDLRQSLFAAYKDSVIHQPATLDEFYYHFASDNDSRRDRDFRNKDQVITKYLKPGGKQELNYWPVLRVSQVWIWIIDEIQMTLVQLLTNGQASKNKGQSTEQTMGHLSSTLGKVARQLCDIKDIRDELNILKTVATFQRKVQYQMAGPCANGDFETDYILGDIREMDRFAEQTQEAVSNV
ncbi:hypothetical protein Brms1b_008633 [Colletotrichum noveboracense]|nr:hypothetical protein Brms1b_008633 [Colletotrichum noveboracense]